jgi:signal transduction histidine kinase
MIEATSCGGVVIFRGKILVLYKNYKNKYEGWVLPKGTVEAGEEYKETALREVKEETGVSASIIKYIGKSQYTFNTPQDVVEKDVHWYLMMADSYYSKPQREEYFLDSGYYTKCIEKKCDDLSDYLRLLIKGESRTSEENRRYLQYTNEFKSGDSNFCYWYRIGEAWYTNQPDTKEGQEFDVEAVLMEAKTMGNYLIYDLVDKEFGTDINGMADYFFGGGNQMLWPADDMTLIIGIDTELSAEDDIYEASREYEQLHPWIKVCTFSGLVSLMGWIISLVYLTLATGRRTGEEKIHLNPIDKIKTEILVAAFIFMMVELVILITKVNSEEWAVYGIIVASGTVSLVIDGLFLIFYLSMVRRMKAEMLWETSVACWLERGIRKVFARQKTTVRVLLLFAGHMAVCFILAVGAFYYRSMTALVLLLLFSAGECYMILRKAVEQYQIRLGVEKIRDGALSGKIDIEQLHGEEKSLAEAINNIGEGLLHAVDDSTKNERMKADLITNVSHDIKTPLTSIINYVNLMKLEKIDNERVQGYIKILDEKSQRLKQLTADLVEASKISSGNVKLDMQVIDLVELVYQTSGEFNEKFEQKELTIVTKLPKTAVLIRADGRQLYRVIENLYNNVAKYALEKTRVYVDIAYVEEKVVFSIKNVSEHSLARENSNAGDLTERFIRGDSSRTTEGSGLGLSIAKSLTVLMGGVFDIKVDGDLFKASITFPQYVDENSSNPKMEEPASEDDYEIEELEPEERTEKE